MGQHRDTSSHIAGRALESLRDRGVRLAYRNRYSYIAANPHRRLNRNFAQEVQIAALGLAGQVAVIENLGADTATK
jgi:hypothetical protein